MKFLLTGAQGTGKTSIMDALSCDIQKIQNITRTCIEKNNLSINENSDNTTQHAIFNSYYDVLTKNDDYLAERSLFDVYAYSKHQFFNNKCDLNILERQKKLIEMFVKENTNAIYFYIPIEFDIVADGTRSINKTFQKEIDNYIRSLLDEFGCKYYTIKGTILERVNEINKIITQYK